MRFFLFIIFAVSATAQSVGDFSINYKANSTGPQSLKTWAKSNSTLWGTNSSGNPQSITLGTGLSLTSGVLATTGSSFDPQSANQVFAGPTTGSAAAPTFRALVANDLPDLSSVYQPIAGILTAFSGLSNATGVLTNNGSGSLSYTATSTGGNKDADSGKLVKFDSVGGVYFSNEVRIYPYPSGSNFLQFNNSRIQWLRGASDYCNIIPSEAGSACTFYFPTNPGTHTLALEDGNITGTAGGLSSTLAVTSGGTGQTSYTDGQLLIGNTTGNTLAKATLTAGSGISITNGHGTITIASTSSGGTVTSVALTLPGIFSVTGSPITESGTLAASLATQTANRVWAGPTTGSAATPTFRALVAGDIPSLSAVYQPKNGNLDTLAAGLGASIGQRVVAWDGSTYALLSGALSVAYGGTSFSSYTPGDILYYGASSMQKLAGNTTATKKFLTQTGTGSASADPAWGTIQGSDITFTDVTTGNATTSNHGYLRKLSGTSTQYLDGSGAWSTPASGATLGTNTFTGAQAYSVNGAASTPAAFYTGSILTGATGTTNFPHLYIQPSGTTAATSLSTSGTALGMNMPSGFAGDYLRIFNNGTQVLRIACGNFDIPTFYGDANYGFIYFNSNVQFNNASLYVAGGILSMSNSGRSTGASFYGDVTAGLISLQSGTTACEYRVHNTFTSSANYEAFSADWQTTSNVCRVGTVVGGSGGTARDMQFVRGGVVKATIGANTTDHTQPVKLPSYIVSGLPSASTCGAGSMAFVTDATLTTAYTTVIGSGSNKVLVISDGTNWVIH